MRTESSFSLHLSQEEEDSQINCKRIGSNILFLEFYSSLFLAQKHLWFPFAKQLRSVDSGPAFLPSLLMILLCPMHSSQMRLLATKKTCPLPSNRRFSALAFSPAGFCPSFAKSKSYPFFHVTFRDSAAAEFFPCRFR